MATLKETIACKGLVTLAPVHRWLQNGYTCVGCMHAYIVHAWPAARIMLARPLAAARWARQRRARDGGVCRTSVTIY